MYNSRACAHKSTDCPLQQAAPSRREFHRNRPRQSLLSPDFGYAPAAAACASEPGVLSLNMAHRLLPHASVSLVFPVNLVSPRWLGACCMRQWARRFSDWKHPSVTLTPAQSLSAYWGGTHCPLTIAYTNWEAPGYNCPGRKFGFNFLFLARRASRRSDQASPRRTAKTLILHFH